MGRGSSGLGAKGGGSKGVARALQSIEDRIRNNPTESAVAIDENGNVLFDTSDGKSGQVGISVEQQEMARGQIITHNHPNGYMFSTDDINVSTALGLKQMRATTPDGRAYVLEKAGEASPGRSLVIDYGRQTRKTASEAAAKAYDPSIRPAEFQRKAALEHTKIMNKWLEENAPKYGYVFREEKGK